MAGELLTDPPELKQHASRGDPPMVKWPGRPVGEADIMRASGDSRDWFRYRHRESAAVTAWAEFADGQARRKDLRVGFDWHQIFILGDYGSGKIPATARLDEMDGDWWAEEARNGMLATYDHPTAQSLMLPVGRGGFLDGDDTISYGQFAVWLGGLGLGYGLGLVHLSQFLGSEEDITFRVTAAQ